MKKEVTNQRQMCLRKNNLKCTVEFLDNGTISKSWKTHTPHYIHTTFGQPDEESSSFRNDACVYIVWCMCF